MTDTDRTSNRAATGGAEGSTSGLRSRIDRWLDSDLVGIPATAYTFVVLALSLLTFRIAGGFAGVIVGAALWIPMVVFAIQGRGRQPGRLSLAPATNGPRHRVLVVANLGLEDPSLCDEVCRRAARTETEALLIVPVVAASKLAEVSDDFDAELRAAEQRLEAALARLRREGVKAEGHTDIAQPMEALLDGLRELSANEIVMLPDREADWDAASPIAERVRREVGLPVTTVKAAEAAPR